MRFSLLVLLLPLFACDDARYEQDLRRCQIQWASTYSAIDEFDRNVQVCMRAAGWHNGFQATKPLK